MGGESDEHIGVIVGQEELDTWELVLPAAFYSLTQVLPGTVHQVAITGRKGKKGKYLYVDGVLKEKLVGSFMALQMTTRNGEVKMILLTSPRRKHE